MKYLAFYAVMVATAHSVPGVAWLTAAAVIVVGCAVIRGLRDASSLRLP